jgi:hypothetical protein
VYVYACLSSISIPPISVWDAFYSPMEEVGWCPLLCYILKTELHKGGYLCRVAQVIAVDSWSSLLYTPSHWSCSRCHAHNPIGHHWGTADQRPRPYLLHHVPSILDRSVLQDVIPYHYLSIHFAGLFLG